MQTNIAFEKPSVKKDFTYVDMHYHTVYSDGRANINKLLKRCKSLNIGVSITDHNEILGCLRASRSPTLVIPGIEVSSAEGIHILFYFYSVKDLEHFYSTYVKPYKESNPIRPIRLDAMQLVESAKTYYSCLVAAAHPLGFRVNSIHKKMIKNKVSSDILQYVDLIEALNGLCTRRFNIKASGLATFLDKKIVGGSDGHTLRELGKAVTYVEEKADINSFLDSIAKGRAFVVGNDTDIKSTIITNSLTFNKHLKYLKYWFEKSREFINKKIYNL